MRDTDKNTLWHNISYEAALEALQTSPHGLAPSEARARLEAHGQNRLPTAVKRSVFLRFLSHFHNILIYVLIGSAVITACLDHWVDTGVILAVVVANAIIGFIQEGKAEKAMDAIRHMLAPHANVIRGGERVSIEGDALVPGDIVLLEAGDKVPADLRLFSAHGLQVQEAILTGESVPVEKHTKPVAEDAPLGDRTCMAFSGTLVTSGQSKGVVVATGKNTEIGRISGLLSEVETLTTPLVTQMGIFAKWLTVLILIIAALLLVFGYFVEHYDFTDMFMAVVGLSVAAIPEGLPAVLTITLAIGVQSMARRNAIVRRLPAIETLGSVSVICTDKTGTLTRNEMMVASVLTADHLFTLEGDGYPHGIMARLPGHEIETLIEKYVRGKIEKLCGEEEGSVLEHVLHHQEAIPAYDLIRKCVSRITISLDEIIITLKPENFRKLVEKHLNVSVTGCSDEFEITVPYKTGSARRGAIVIEPKGEKDVLDLPSDKLKKLVQGVIWRDEHFDGMALKDIAAREGCSQAYVGTAIFQSFEILQST